MQYVGKGIAASLKVHKNRLKITRIYGNLIRKIGMYQENSEEQGRGMSMKQKKYWKHALLCMLVLVMMLCPLEVQAASQKTKAMKAYKSMLSKKTMRWGNDPYYKAVPTNTCRFTIAYIDNNSVPELIVESSYVTRAAGTVVIYTYRNGKVQVVKNSTTGKYFADSGKFSYYKKKGIFISTYVMGGVTDNYYKMSKNKASLKLQADNSLMYGRSYYNASKKITKKTFDKSLKKLVGSKKKTNAKFYKNTAANRKKYLK